MGRFDEKIMLVTGATSGIGRAVAIRAAKKVQQSLRWGATKSVERLLQQQWKKLVEKENS